jgi:putative multiple sugar transport system substrate-binding protein
MTRRFAITALGAAVALVLAACGGEGAGSGTGAGESAGPAAAGESAAPEDLTIGVSMPTQTSERWIADGEAVESQLKDAGYGVDLQFAGDDIPTQSQQVDQMITQGADVLIIAAIDGTALGGQLEAAAEAGIPVIAYDRLIRDSEHVDFYTTFDNFAVGQAQANALLTGLGVLNADGSEGEATGPFNVELFAGSLDDNNAFFFFDGAMDVLQPYIDDGTLVVKSGQTSIEDAATLRWDQAKAQQRMDDLLTGSYNDGSRVDGVLSPYDGLSRGIITALTNSGYGPSLTEGDQPMPVVTGQDAEIASVKLIADGVQSSTIFKDTRLLAEQAVAAAEAFLAGGEPEPNDTETYDNGVKVVPSYLLPVETVTAENIEQALVESGYYTAEEVESGQAG